MMVMRNGVKFNDPSDCYSACDADQHNDADQHAWDQIQAC